MPEPASSRSLEDILASIRKSLADESVDGLVELSAAAVDAARAERAKPSVAVASTPAEVLADDLLREKLAGALEIEPEISEAAVREDEAALEEAEAPSEVAAEEEPPLDGDALAKLWVLRPGIEQAKPVTPVPQQSLSLDPFAEAASSAEPAPKPDFKLSPLELLGRLVPKAMSMSSMPPVPPVAASSEPPSPAEAAGPPRLDEASIALLQKLRASNAAAIEKIAQSNAESEQDVETTAAVASPQPEPASDRAAETDTVPTDVAPFSELLQSVATQEAAASAVAEHATETADAPAAPEVIVEAVEDVRPLLTLPERSTPLFGGQGDARPPLTSGLDHLLPETGAEPLKIEDVVEAVDASDLQNVHQPNGLDAGAEPEVQDVALSAPEGVPVQEAVVESPSLPASAPEPIGAEPDEVQTAAPPGPNKALEDMIAAVLEPVLQRLIETSIGPALEVLVRREVERVLKEQSPPN